MSFFSSQGYPQLRGGIIPLFYGGIRLIGLISVFISRLPVLHCFMRRGDRFFLSVDFLIQRCMHSGQIPERKGQPEQEAGKQFPWKQPQFDPCDAEQFSFSQQGAGDKRILDRQLRVPKQQKACQRIRLAHNKESGGAAGKRDGQRTDGKREQFFRQTDRKQQNNQQRRAEQKRKKTTQQTFAAQDGKSAAVCKMFHAAFYRKQTPQIGGFFICRGGIKASPVGAGGSGLRQIIQDGKHEKQRRQQEIKRGKAGKNRCRKHRRKSGLRPENGGASP